MKPFTVCILLYGNYPGMAERLLKSLSRPAWYPKFDLRIGLNDVSDATMRVVGRYSGDGYSPLRYFGELPFYKYPLMRNMFWQQTPFPTPIETPYTMWFDDDSWLSRRCPDQWFSAVAASLDTADMLGSIWEKDYEGDQRQFIEQMPWYTGKPLLPKMRFCTGGWWAIKTRILERWNWPDERLEHNGGDTLLGALCHQQGYRLQNAPGGVHINADDAGRCSTAPRRGFSQRPLGWNYRVSPDKSSPAAPPVASHDTWLDILEGKA